MYNCCDHCFDDCPDCMEGCCEEECCRTPPRRHRRSVLDAR